MLPSYTPAVVIDGELIARVAQLASLDPPPAETEALARQLTRIVEHFEALRSVPDEVLGDVTLAERGPAREDLSRAAGTPAFAMENAPESSHGHFVVPRVVVRG